LKKTSEKALFGLILKQKKLGSVKEWDAVRIKGFKKYYISNAWRWFAFIFAQQALYHLFKFRLPTQDDWICIMVVGALFGAVMPPILWKSRQSEYEARTKKPKRQHDFKKWYF